MNLWMVYACNMKSSGKYSKVGKEVNVLCIADWNHQISLVAVDYSRNFKGIWSMMLTTWKMGGISEGEIRNWKKMKLKS